MNNKEVLVSLKLMLGMNTEVINILEEVSGVKNIDLLELYEYYTLKLEKEQLNIRRKLAFATFEFIVVKGLDEKNENVQNLIGEYARSSASYDIINKLNSYGLSLTDIRFYEHVGTNTIDIVRVVGLLISSYITKTGIEIAKIRVEGGRLLFFGKFICQLKNANSFYLFNILEGKVIITGEPERIVYYTNYENETLDIEELHRRR